MKFQAGQSGNRNGRPKGSYGGRIQALALLDRLMARSKNKKLLVKALQEEFEENPSRFFKTVVMPLLPKESKVAVGTDGIVAWKSLVESFPLPEKPAGTAAEG